MRLRAVERRWLEAVFATILPGGVVDGLPGADEVAWDLFLDELEAAAPARMLLGLRGALWFVVLLAPLLLLGRLRTFMGLAAPERLRVLDAFRRSRFYLVRELPVLLKSVACLGYFRHPGVLERMAPP